MGWPNPGATILALCLLGFGAALVTASAVAKAPKAAAKWMAHCTANLEEDLPKQRRAVQTYCRCVAWLGDDAEMLAMTQSDLEHSYPPAHRQCYKEAGLKPS